MAPKYNVTSGFRDRAWLYTFVFFGRVSLLVVLLLLLSFIIQPINQAMAQTEEPAVADDVVPQDPTELETTNKELEQSAPQTESAPVTIDSTESAVADIYPVESTTVDVPDEDFLDLATLDEFSSTTPDSTALTTETLDEDESSSSTASTASTTTTATTTNDPVLDTDDLTIDDGEESPRTLEEIQAEVQEELNSRDQPTAIETITSDENFFQFDRQSCVAVGNGSYHCTVNTAPSLDESTVVYADRGENGSMQIFIRTTKGGVKQITNTIEDNTSPHVSAEARQVTWQRLIDGRYQIFVYDIEKGEERQLTFSRTNNMEPKVSTDGIVWQAWDGNDWEIMYFDGTFTDQITDNTIQDVAPTIEDRYILWSVLGTDKSQAKVYSLDSQETLTITGQDGGTIANPRFVLVYDTKFENGDIITQGFNPITGEITPLGAAPAPEPIDIPDPDPLGEVRALVNTKTDDEHDLDLVFADDPTASSTLNLSATSTTQTLDLTTITDDDQGSTTIKALEQTDFELTDYDLVITEADFQAATTSATLAFVNDDEMDEIAETASSSKEKSE